MALRQPIFQSGPSAEINQTLPVFFQASKGDSLPVSTSSQHLFMLLCAGCAWCQSRSCPNSFSCWHSGASQKVTLTYIANGHWWSPLVQPGGRSPPTPVAHFCPFPRYPGFQSNGRERGCPVPRAGNQPPFSRPISQQQECLHSPWLQHQAPSLPAHLARWPKTWARRPSKARLCTADSVILDRSLCLLDLSFLF